MKRPVSRTTIYQPLFASADWYFRFCRYGCHFGWGVSFGTLSPLKFSRQFIMVYYMERYATNLIALRSLWLAWLTDCLTPILLTCRIWWAPNNASRWQMGFNLAFTGFTVVTAWTACFYTQKLLIFSMLCLCVSYHSHNKQRLFI